MILAPLDIIGWRSARGDVGSANSDDVGSVEGIKGNGVESLSLGRKGGGGVGGMKLDDRISAMQFGQIPF